MATPFKNPRDGILYFRREVPEKLRAAIDGKREVKVSLGTRDPAEAKAPFARENAKFEDRLGTLGDCSPKASSYSHQEKLFANGARHQRLGTV